MDNNNNILTELLKSLCYKKTDDTSKSHSSCQCKIDPSGGADTNCCADVNLDIEGGFQDIDPLVFSIMGEILGNVLSGKLPFNVANSVANFLALVGQIIETYAAQQQYQQSGPGRFFNPAYKNVTNPFCESSSNDNTADSSSSSLDNYIEKTENIQVQLEIISKTIKNLDNRICILESELNKNNDKL